jgi:hypothetical protein
VADFLTKSLGRGPFKELTREAMGYTTKTDISRFGNNNWRENYKQRFQDNTELIDEDSKFQASNEWNNDKNHGKFQNFTGTSIGDAQEARENNDDIIPAFDVTREGFAQGRTEEKAAAGSTVELRLGNPTTSKQDIATVSKVTVQLEQDTDGTHIQEGPHSSVRGGMKKVHLVSCNTMMVQSTLQGNNEYLCKDFDDFLKYEQHSSALIIDTLIREMKYETKQYEGLVILDSPPQSEESKYNVHD